LSVFAEKDSMKKSKYVTLFILLALISSCSTNSIKKMDPVADTITGIHERLPASEQESCKVLANNIINQDSKPAPLLDEVETADANAIKKLQEKGLLKFKDRFLILNTPGRDWINSVRKNFISHLKKWNKNRYPIFYMTDDNNIQKIGAQLPELLEKKLNNSLSDEETKIFDSAMAQVEMFANYQRDIEALIDERVSLQYNIEVLKKLKLDDKPMDVKIVIKRAEGETEEIVTIRKEDKNKSLVIDKLKKQLKEINGKVFRFGKIEERVIKQAYLKDILTIYHREVEYAHKNGLHASDDLAKLYEKLDQALVNSDFVPSSYGVYRVDKQVLRSEFMMFTGLDKGVVKVTATKDKIKSGFKSFFTPRNAAADAEKMGFFESIYNSITNMTVADLSKYGMTAAVGFGASQYLMVDKQGTDVTAVPTEVTEVNPEAPGIVVPDPNNEVAANHQKIISTRAKTHTEQLANTKKVEESYVASKYHMVQDKISELFN